MTRAHLKWLKFIFPIEKTATRKWLRLESLKSLRVDDSSPHSFRSESTLLQKVPSITFYLQWLVGQHDNSNLLSWSWKERIIKSTLIPRLMSVESALWHLGKSPYWEHLTITLIAVWTTKQMFTFAKFNTLFVHYRFIDLDFDIKYHLWCQQHFHFLFLF